MRVRTTGIALTLLVAMGISLYAAPCCFSGNAAAQGILSQQQLGGSMQGQCGIALDLNSDGNDELIVGAPYARQNGANGAVLVYRGTSEGFSDNPAATLTGTGNYGWTLVSLDAVRGGKQSFAVGALSGTGDKASLAGTVTVYENSPARRKASLLGRLLSPGNSRSDQSQLAFRQIALIEGENALDKFGYAMAAGDLNNDGIQDIIVGAPYHSPTPELYQQGAVYVYFGPNYRAAGSIKIPSSDELKGLGFSVASGDVNGDGADDLLLGATGYDEKHQAVGQVVVFHGPLSRGNAPTEPDLVFTGSDAGFGRSIAVLWDMDGDGKNEIAIGAHQALIAGVADTGRLFILKGDPAGARVVSASTGSLAIIDGESNPPGNKPGNSGRFASGILPGDFDLDGKPDLAVSAIHADGAFPMTGKLYVFKGDTLLSGSAMSAAKLIPGAAKDMHFGSFMSVAASSGGNKLAVGAPTEKANTGTVRLFDLPLNRQ